MLGPGGRVSRFSTAAALLFRSISLGIGIPFNSRIASTSLCFAPMWNASLSWLWNSTLHWEQLFVMLMKSGQFSVNLAK